MRGLALLPMLLLALALAPAGFATPPLVDATATPSSGIAPLRVKLAASGDPATYTWSLGDGTAAAGAVVEHTYGPGRHVVVVTATNELGETGRAELVVSVTARTLALAAPAVGDYDGPTILTGELRPGVPGARVQIHRGGTYVGSAAVQRDGRFRAAIRLRVPGAYEARYGGLRSEPRTIAVRPTLEVAVPETVAVGDRQWATARLVPPAAGGVSVRIVGAGGKVLAHRRGGGGVRLAVPAGKERQLRVLVESRAAPGFVEVRRTLRSRVVLPTLVHGSRGPAVLALERRLATLRYALRGADDVYGWDTVEAVFAFQKVHGLPRTGRVDPGLWRWLERARIPAPRAGGGSHLEVDKGRNVLYDVVGGRVDRIVHVSTGATGNTPVGTFYVYRKVAGWDWVLWYPMYFLRGFAVHGYPSVPAYPASHGCVRVPMWIATSLFARHGYGTRIVVFA